MFGGIPVGADGCRPAKADAKIQYPSVRLPSCKLVQTIGLPNRSTFPPRSSFMRLH